MPRWLAVLDGYCERTDAGYWSEPLNAISNASFLVAAVIVWRMARAVADRPAQVLALGAASIGIGSYLFHTHATVWAMQADIYPIRIFVLLFVGLAAVRFFGLPWWGGVAATTGFVLFSELVVRSTATYLGHLHGSVGYLPVPILMVAVAFLLLRRSPDVAQGLVAGAGVFTVSLALRTVDQEICSALPLGTHFAWHLLNGVVIGWMVALFIRSGEAAANDRQSPGLRK